MYCIVTALLKVYIIDMAQKGDTIQNFRKDFDMILNNKTLQLYFLVAKLLYKSKCPSVCLSECMSGLGGNVIFSAPN